MSALRKLETAVTLLQMSCPKCGGVFGLNESFYDYKQREGGYWYCPYCQAGRGWEEGQQERDRKSLQAQLDRAISRANEAETALAYTKVRTIAGVCPCCNRSFKGLARHMAHMHPEYSK